MNKKIVLDTNVLVSALLNPGGSPGRILDLFLMGKIDLLLDDRIYQEYQEVLLRKKFNFPRSALQNLFSFIEQQGIFITSIPLNIKLPNPKDLKFLEVALGYEDAILVTGNIKDFPKGKCRSAIVIKPMDFLLKYNKNFSN